MGHRHGSGDIRSGCVRWGGGADSPRSRADPRHTSRQYSQGTHTVQTQVLGRGFLLPVTQSTSQLAKEARHRTRSRSPTRMAGRSDLRPIQCVKAIFSTDGSSDRSPAISATPSQTTSPSPPKGHIKTQNNAWRINPDEGILLALATGMTGMGGMLASHRHRSNCFTLRTSKVGFPSLQSDEPGLCPSQPSMAAICF